MTLLLALLIDSVFGEPRWIYDRLPHPAVVIGRVIGMADRRINAGNLRFWKGLFLISALCIVGALIGVLIQHLGVIVTALAAATLLAQRSLVDHVRDVARSLRYGLTAGRNSVAMIVGRDTRDMDPSAVRRAAIESAAENLSDGVIAPIFWFVIAGLPGLLVYKIVNTADSMIGYRNHQYEDFGKASARLDDAMNWIPARLTALLIQTSHGIWPSLSALAADAGQHRSPNAGWPEAAMARALNVALSGPRSYDGMVQDFPWVNPAGRKTLAAADIDAAADALWRVWGLVFGLVFAVAGIRWLI